MGDVLIRAVVAAAFVCGLSAGPAFAASPSDEEELVFRFKDPRITESSGLALSPTHNGIFYTHNDSSAEAVFFAVGKDGRTRATYTVRGAQARDWEAMAASKDPVTGKGVLWFADIGDNFDGAWPDVSVYKVTEPTSLRDATLPATRYRFRYEDGGHNAEGILVHPKTGRLSVVTKQFSGGIYQAPRKLRADRTNILRKVGSAPLMATDAAYAPDGSSFVIRTYFSASVFRAPDDLIDRVSMPDLEQAESIAYTADGTALLAGSEGANSPLYRIPLPAKALPGPSATPSREPATPDPVAARPSEIAADAPAEQPGISGSGILLWLAVAIGATGVITVIARRTR